MYDIILFDLDGTLTDPKEGITKSIQYALAKMGIIEEDLDRLIPFIGPPLLDSFKEFYDMDDVQAKAALGYYRERFSTVGLYENTVFAGIPELLEQLRQAGKELVVATSKPTVFSVQILEHFGLNHHFRAIIGSNLDGSRVEKADVIEFALSELGDCRHKKMIMVGDRKHDVIGARRNGLDVVAVGYGYGDEEELHEAKPDYIVTSVEQLTALLQKDPR